jgi:hyperosmotically inducible protein
MIQHRRHWSAAIAIVALTGCARTDVGITAAIKANLATDDTVKAYQIDVDTKESVVTLTGSVDHAAAKARAAEIARDTPGVFQVIDHLTIREASVAAPGALLTDGALTAAVKARLIADTTVAGLPIDVDTHDAVVTLTGEVRSQVEKDVALRLARETAGVRSVSDQLSIAVR